MEAIFKSWDALNLLLGASCSDISVDSIADADPAAGESILDETMPWLKASTDGPNSNSEAMLASLEDGKEPESGDKTSADLEMLVGSLVPVDLGLLSLLSLLSATAAKFDVDTSSLSSCS